MSDFAPSLRARVLVAEDQIHLRLIERMLAALGHSCESVQDGSSLLYAIERSTYDILLIDLDLPNLDGPATIRQIHARYHTPPAPRIITLTAASNDAARLTYRASGVDEWLKKPLLSDDLQAALGGFPTEATQRRDQELRRRLQELTYVGGPLFLQELIDLLLSEGGDRFQKIDDSLAASNYPQAAEIFQLLQGSAASIGAAELHAICALGEEACERSEKVLAEGCHRLGIEELTRVGLTFLDWEKRIDEDDLDELTDSP